MLQSLDPNSRVVIIGNERKGIIEEGVVTAFIRISRETARVTIQSTALPGTRYEFAYDANRFGWKLIAHDAASAEVPFSGKRFYSIKPQS